MERVTGSSVGFTLPNSNTLAPDVSFVKAEQLRRAPRNFAQLVVFEAETKPYTLRDGNMLALPNLLPGWSVAVSGRGPPVFDKE